jgi:hypothetical protein
MYFSPQFVVNGEICYPVEDNLFKELEWINGGVPLKELFVPEMTYMNPYYVGPILKIRSFFARFDEMIHGPEFSKEELYCCIVSVNVFSMFFLEIIIFVDL